MRMFYIIIRVLEILLLFSILGFFIFLLCVCEDRVTLKDSVCEYAVGLLWLFPISIPLLACVIFSFVKSITFKSRYSKFIFLIHVLNIIILPFSSLFLPNPPEPTAKLMAENFQSHTKEISRLVNYVDSLVGDKGGFTYEINYGKPPIMSIKQGKQWLHQDDIYAIWAQNKEVAGISKSDVCVVDSLLQAANVQGVDCIKDDMSFSILFRQWGKSQFRYTICRAKFSQIEKGYKCFIHFNDSVSFERYGIYPGNGSFVDYDQFIKASTH